MIENQEQKMYNAGKLRCPALRQRLRRTKGVRTTTDYIVVLMAPFASVNVGVKGSKQMQIYVNFLFFFGAEVRKIYLP